MGNREGMGSRSIRLSQTLMVVTVVMELGAWWSTLLWLGVLETGGYGIGEFAFVYITVSISIVHLGEH
ncbi:hypothetical protein EX30DRAFT_165549 [Ascodesmis nigricans]|uniref:Uncharacterized protein n=1 Tax=Ascodesmis nigricans TaxID=341454 RepID=A0A4S2MS27_9PEZI|nr:hypothetical protein EX30DRAFT_165549 [Ascodesmis nigricans]